MIQFQFNFWNVGFHRWCRYMSRICKVIFMIDICESRDRCNVLFISRTPSIAHAHLRHHMRISGITCRGYGYISRYVYLFFFILYFI